MKYYSSHSLVVRLSKCSYPWLQVQSVKACLCRGNKSEFCELLRYHYKKHGFALLQFSSINLKICLLHLSSDSSKNILYEICLPNLQLLSCSSLTSWQQQSAGLLLFPCFMFRDRLHTVVMDLSEKQDQWRDLAPIWVWINGLHAQPGLHQVPFSDNWTRAWMWEDRGWGVLSILSDGGCKQIFKNASVAAGWWWFLCTVSETSTAKQRSRCTTPT